METTPTTENEPVAEPATDTTTEPLLPPRPPVKHLVRGPGGPVGGVATGIANYFGVDPLVAQIGFVVATVLGGTGVLLYIAGWLLIPAFDQDPAQRNGVFRIVLGSLGLIAGVLAILSIFGGSFAASALLVAAGVYFLTQRPGESAALGESVKDLLRPRDQVRHPVPAYDYPPPASAGPDQVWGTPHTDGADLAGIGFAPTGQQPAPPRPFTPRPPKEPTPPGPPITSVTLAVAALTAGLMIWLDRNTGASISTAAVFGSVLGFCGLGLVVSAFTGRAWGLLPVGLIAAFGVAVSPIVDLAAGSEGFGEVSYDVEDQDALMSEYKLSAGQLTLDLSTLDLDEDATVSATIGAGQLIVIVPDDMAVDATGSARVGDVTVFFENDDGFAADVSKSHRLEDAATDAPVLTIDADVRFGEVTIRHDN